MNFQLSFRNASFSIKAQTGKKQPEYFQLKDIKSAISGYISENKKSLYFLVRPAEMKNSSLIFFALHFSIFIFSFLFFLTNDQHEL